jgi:DNA-directed RNA polymerase specialized sigma24 family protein
MQDSSFHPTAPAPPPPEVIRAAFRDLHGPRLHGFALLVTLGDRSLAAQLSADAFAAASRRIDELRHPERAAAWLRARVVSSLPRRLHEPPPTERRAGLGAFGIDDAVIESLAALRPLERAALVASGIERLDRRDVAVVVGHDGARLDRILARARRTYVSAFAAAPSGASPDHGSITTRVHAAATRAMQ